MLEKTNTSHSMAELVFGIFLYCQTLADNGIRKKLTIYTSFLYTFKYYQKSNLNFYGSML